MTEYKLSLPWIEKYRPKLLEDVVGNEEAVMRLQVVGEDGNMPNMILSGPPGTGKTTSMLCLSRKLLGKSYKDGVLELNASDARTLDVVRNTIKSFSKTKVTLPQGRHKIVILDEADSMTKGAQQALRRIMEIYSSSTRFCFACNLSNKIIEPIQSRCAIVRYRPLSVENIYECLERIAKSEKVKYTQEGLEAILYCAEGDMRNAINTLQACSEGFENVIPENVFKVVDMPHPAIIERILTSCRNVNLNEALKDLKILYKVRGYSVQDIVGSFSRVIRNDRSGSLPEYLQLMFVKKVGEYHMRIVDGVCSDLQLCALIASLCRISNEFLEKKKKGETKIQ